MDSLSIIPWRINPVSILAAAIALVGAFLPWWGFDVSGIINQVHRWTIWNPPRFNTQVPGGATVSWNFTISSVSVLVLVLVATALVVCGSLTLLRRYLLGGLVLLALAPRSEERRVGKECRSGLCMFFCTKSMYC